MFMFDVRRRDLEIPVGLALNVSIVNQFWIILRLLLLHQDGGSGGPNTKQLETSWHRISAATCQQL